VGIAFGRQVFALTHNLQRPTFAKPELASILFKTQCIIVAAPIRNSETAASRVEYPDGIMSSTFKERSTKATKTHLTDVRLISHVFLSPFTKIAFQNLPVAMTNANLRFWAVGHISRMIIGLAFAHIGRVKVRQASTDLRKQRIR